MLTQELLSGWWYVFVLCLVRFLVFPIDPPYTRHELPNTLIGACAVWVLFVLTSRCIGVAIRRASQIGDLSELPLSPRLLDKWVFLNDDQRRIVTGEILRGNHTSAMRKLLEKGYVQPYLAREHYLTSGSNDMKNLLGESLTMYQLIKQEFRRHPLSIKFGHDIAMSYLLPMSRTYI